MLHSGFQTGEFLGETHYCSPHLQLMEEMLFHTKALSCLSRLFPGEVKAVILHSLPIASTWYKAETHPCPESLISNDCWESIFSFVNTTHALLVTQEVFKLIPCVQHLFRQFMCLRGYFPYISHKKKWDHAAKMQWNFPYKRHKNRSQSISCFLYTSNESLSFQACCTTDLF